MSAWGIFTTLFVVVAPIAASDSSVCAAGHCDHMSVLQAKVDKHEARDHKREAANRTQVAKFVVGGRHQTVCPSGFGPITHESDCKVAAKALGKSYVAAGSWVTSPKGCLTSEWDGRGVYFNSHATGSAHADQAPICADAPAPATCQGDRATWNAGYGKCSTYASQNKNFCSSDSSGGVLAKDACSECDVCEDPPSGSSSGSACKGLGLEDFEGETFTITQESSLHGGATYTYSVKIGGEINQHTSDSGDYLIGKHVSYGPGNEQFQNGNWCGMDVQRSATVTFSFGPELKLLSAQEPSMCVYEYHVQLPEERCHDLNAVQTPAPTPPGVPAFPDRFKFTHAGYWNNFRSLIAPFGERGTMTKDECADTCWDNQKCAGFNMKPLPDDLFRCYHYDVMEFRVDHEGSWAYIKIFE